MRALLVLLVACSAPPAPSQPKPLTAADVGLTDEPAIEPTSPPQLVPRPVRPGYFRKEECPPNDRGCWVEQEVTHERVTVRWRCRGSSSSMVGGHALRHLRSDLNIGEGGIERRAARRALLHADDSIRGCFDTDGTAQHIELRFTIHNGRMIDLDTPWACVREALERLDVPREPSFTPVVWTFDYTLDDPASVPHLDCS